MKTLSLQAKEGEIMKNVKTHDCLGGIAMGEKVVFHLSRHLEILGDHVDPYESIRSGRKTVEYRPYSRYWRLILIQANPRPTKAWFVVGYPKDNLPRLEADITRIVRRHPTNQIEVHFENVVEITK